MFQLDEKEFKNLMFQIGISNLEQRIIANNQPNSCFRKYHRQNKVFTIGNSALYLHLNTTRSCLI